MFQRQTREVTTSDGFRTLRSEETTGFTKHQHKHKHQAAFPTIQQQSACPVFTLLEVLGLSSQRRCVIDGAEEQATTQTRGKSAHAAHSHMHAWMKPRTVELISKEGHLQMNVDTR